MSSLSTKLGLIVPTVGDSFSTADIAQNWETIDAAPGMHICTSTTRPTDWGAEEEGRHIYETDTELQWAWSGTRFDRAVGGQGVLRKTDGNFAIGEKFEDFSTPATNYTKVVSVTEVVVPDGLRSLMLIATFYQAHNEAKNFMGAIFRSDTSASGPIVTQQILNGALQPQGSGGSIIGFIPGGLNAGTYDFSLQIKSQSNNGGTSTLKGGPLTPISIAAVEL